MFTALSGRCSCDKDLPLRCMGGLTLELELVNTLAEWIITDSWSFPAVTASEGVPAQAAFTAISEESISREWIITEVAAKADLIVLDHN